MTRAFLLFILSFIHVSVSGQVKVEKWKVFELVLQGPSTGNPFMDVDLSAVFQQAEKTFFVEGFYDGSGVYKIRFMPPSEGEWAYVTTSNSITLNEKRGGLIATPPRADNHGPVQVSETFSFAYADGKPHYSLGTTCYAWMHQGDSLADLTLKTLSKGYFNKLRMCIFPKYYAYNRREPLLYPFEGKPLTDWDYTRFNPAYFRNIERRIRQLDSLAIEADLIVFHSYDHWGFQNMDAATDDRYIRYIIARFAAFKNVWWSMANEYDLLEKKSHSDWDRFIKLFFKKDPYQHLRSIHQAYTSYNHSDPLLTHVSIQSPETSLAKELTLKHNKPVVFDEIRYEGNIPYSWGNLTAQEMVNRFWQGVTNGGHIGHGETYTTEKPLQSPERSNDILWWSHGGELKGESQHRIKFLRQVLEKAPGFLSPVWLWDEKALPYSAVGFKDEYFLIYLGIQYQPRGTILNLPNDKKYSIEVIDTWNMKLSKLPGIYSGQQLIELPAKPGMALRVTAMK